ncbi:MAG: two-component system response regulator NarL [Piscirickettsiaceae bacterium]|nr:MAG: two-component system response regulator NarL [Piscirickettsiaceae bacterium]
MLPKVPFIVHVHFKPCLKVRKQDGKYNEGWLDGVYGALTNGLDTLSALRNLNIKSKVVMLTVSDNETDVLQAIKLGADGYLLKDSEPEDIIDQLYKALSGELVLAPSLNRIIARSIQGSTNIPSIFNQLTKREMEVLKLITQGGSNKTIGNILSITEATVKVHVKSLLKKLNLRSRVEAAVWAIENKVTL